METLRHRFEEYSHKLFHTKGHISVMIEHKTALTIHIQELSVTCSEMDETISDLDKVRDAIHIFDVCAGLGRPNFHIPEYTGEFKSEEIDTTHMTDVEIDEALNLFERL